MIHLLEWGLRTPAAAWAGATAGVAITAGLLNWWGVASLAGALVVAFGLAAGGLGGLALVQWLLARTSGIASVAGAVVDEAVRLRSSVVLLLILVAVLPVLPLVLDPTERLAYRVQFLLTWMLGGTGLILGLLTACLACGTVAGDIDTGRIQMALAKPLHRWEYLVGKWLGIVLYDLVLVAVAGAGTYAIVSGLAAGPAADEADRQAVDREVLVARRQISPMPDRPEEYAAAIAAATARLESDSPAGSRLGSESTRRRIRQEYDWQWHTVAPDMETTYVFPGAGTAAAAGGDVQLQFEPRANNVDVDFAEVRFAVWLNDRPWPLVDGVHRDQTFTSRARHVLELPRELVAEAADLRVRIANRNLIPPGETRPTAITFLPGNGLLVLVRTGGFEANVVRCLVIAWAKLALVAAAGVALGAMLDFPAAVLATLVVFCGALGSGFFQEALGSYAILTDNAWDRAAERVGFTTGFIRQGRFYEAFRMLFGFVTDGLLAVLPSFSADASIQRLATGTVIPLRDVLGRVLVFVGGYPLGFGLIGWLVFDRRDLVRSSS